MRAASRLGKRCQKAFRGGIRGYFRSSFLFFSFLPSLPFPPLPFPSKIPRVSMGHNYNGEKCTEKEFHLIFSYKLLRYSLCISFTPWFKWSLILFLGLGLGSGSESSTQQHLRFYSPSLLPLVYTPFLNLLNLNLCCST